MAISKGDKVSWNTSQGKTTGKAVEKKTEDFTFEGQNFKPTDDDPYWIVESEKSGLEGGAQGVGAQYGLTRSGAVAEAGRDHRRRGGG